MLGMAYIELRNHSRERGPHICKLLDETYNGICFTGHFLGSEGVHTLCCAECPRMYVLACQLRCRYTEREAWNAITHPVNDPLQIHQPTLYTSGLFSYTIMYHLPSA